MASAMLRVYTLSPWSGDTRTHDTPTYKRFELSLRIAGPTSSEIDYVFNYTRPLPRGDTYICTNTQLAQLIIFIPSHIFRAS